MAWFKCNTFKRFGSEAIQRYTTDKSDMDGAFVPAQ